MYFSFLVYYLKSIYKFLIRHPYLLFFSVVYGCVMCKYSLNMRMNALHRQKKTIAKLREELNVLELQYLREVYMFLQEKI